MNKPGKIELVNTAWLREGDSRAEPLRDFPIGKPVALVNGKTLITREHRKTLETKTTVDGALYTCWEIWGELH